MKIKVIILMVIFIGISIAFTCSNGRSKPEATIPIEELDLLRYEPIDFAKILVKPSTEAILTDRNPFISPFEEYMRSTGEADEYKAVSLGPDSMRLTGIIKSPDGYIALIRPVSENKTQVVKVDGKLGKFHVTKITDKEVHLTANGTKSVLKLGGIK
ncbi:hypothetical protein ACFL0T_08795 [Candidatus Omnitrophota bacterium]